MSLLSNREACDVANAFLYTLYGDKTFYRWKEVKDKMKFEAERDYVNWLLDIVEHYDIENDSSKQSKRRRRRKKHQENTSDDAGDDEWNVPAGLAEVTNGAEGGGDEIGDDDWAHVGAGIDDDYEERPAQPYMPSDIKAPDGISSISPNTSSTLVKNEASYTVPGPKPRTRSSPAGVLSAQQLLDMNVNADGKPEVHRKFPCNMCNYAAKEATTLKRHKLNIHERNRRKPHLCPMCKYKGSTASHLREHMVNKHGAPSKHTCSKCNRPFSARPNMEAHEKRCRGPIDPEKKEFLCNYCAFSSAYKNSLKKHINMIHEKKEYHACPHCDYVTLRKSNFKAHLIYKHKYESAHKCDKCMRHFSYPAKLEQHKERCGVAKVQMVLAPNCAVSLSAGNWHTATPTATVPAPPATTEQEPVSVVYQ